ncbi:MAG: hypothetical protein ACTSR2_08195, partial [Candidatus Hodarchaeales archaeon]
GLTADIVKEFSHKYFNIPIENLGKGSDDVYDILIKIASFDDEKIRHLYNALFRSDYSKPELLLRFAVFIRGKSSDIVGLGLPTNPVIEKYDLKLLDRNNKEIWVFVSEKDMDLKNLESFAKKVFSIDFQKHPKIKETIIISKSFSYMAKQMIAKYHKALTAVNEKSNNSTELWRTLPVTLWQAEKNSLNFSKIPLI